MAEPDWAAPGELGASSVRQSLLELGLPGARATAVIGHASQAVRVVQLMGEVPGIAGCWPLLAVTGL